MLTPASPLHFQGAIISLGRDYAEPSKARFTLLDSNYPGLPADALRITNCDGPGASSLQLRSDAIADLSTELATGDKKEVTARFPAVLKDVLENDRFEAVSFSHSGTGGGMGRSTYPYVNRFDKAFAEKRAPIYKASALRILAEAPKPELKAVTRRYKASGWLPGFLKKTLTYTGQQVRMTVPGSFNYNREIGGPLHKLEHPQPYPGRPF